MNYLALFLDENSFVEKTLALMRFISNPRSRSYPHITVRLFKESASRVDELKQRTFTHLNIVEPGTFNVEEGRAPYVVYLRCESEELEGIEYKPDFPYSRLHITIYEGNDYLYAVKLYEMLKKRKWHFQFLFDKPRKLTKRKIGTKSNTKINYEKIFKEVLGEGYGDFINDNENVELKLEIMEQILCKLECFLEETNAAKIDSIYENKKNIGNNIKREEMGFGQFKFNFNSPYKDDRFVVEKPVRDAIYITPPEYARDMAKCGLEAFGKDDRRIDFGDSSAGTGVLFLALKHLIDEINKEKNKNFILNSAIGIDIDSDMVDEAYARCNKRGLTVIHGDALSPNIKLNHLRNLMLVNPPFNRHEEIPAEYKNEIGKFAQEQTGIYVPKNAGLYVYHLLIMDKWLSDDSVAVWLLPTIFMQAKYGEAIKNYLLNNVDLLRIHVYDETLEQFNNALVSTSIIVFKKSKKRKSKEVLITYGESVEKPNYKKYIVKEELRENLNDWRVLFENDSSKVNMGKTITFGDAFEIKRGLATGANSFFVMTRERARQHEIPDEALRPIIPKARYLKSLVIESKEDGYPNVEPELVVIDCNLDEITIQNKYPKFYDYLQQAKEKDSNGNSIIDRYLIRKRKLWYKQETREVPTFLLTYMGRNKRDLPPLYFIWNKSKGVALNTYLLLYPKDWLAEKLNENSELYEYVLDALNQSAELIISRRTRIYSGGLKKIEPKELERLPIVGLDKIL